MEWRSVPGWPAYEVSDSGEIRRFGKNKIRRPFHCQDGYLRIAVFNKGHRDDIYVHVLVCLAFVGERPSDLHQVAHNNGVRNDNRASNLRWATAVENQADQLIHGTKKRGTATGRAKLKDDEVREIRASLQTSTVRTLASRYGVSRWLISRIKTGEAWGWME